MFVTYHCIIPTLCNRERYKAADNMSSLLSFCYVSGRQKNQAAHPPVERRVLKVVRTASWTGEDTVFTLSKNITERKIRSFYIF